MEAIVSQLEPREAEGEDFVAAIGPAQPLAMADEAPKAGKSRNSNRRISFNDQATVVAATAAAEASIGSSEDVLKARWTRRTPRRRRGTRSTPRR